MAREVGSFATRVRRSVDLACAVCPDHDGLVGEALGMPEAVYKARHARHVTAPGEVEMKSPVKVPVPHAAWFRPAAASQWRMWLVSRTVRSSRGFRGLRSTATVIGLNNENK